MKKARIIFNGREKLVEITEEFHTQFRVLEELAMMALEESKFLHPPKEYAHLPYVEMPKEVLDDIFTETPLDDAFEKCHQKYQDALMDLIEKSFDVIINRVAFSGESGCVSEEDMANGIVMQEEHDDYPFMGQEN